MQCKSGSTYPKGKASNRFQRQIHLSARSSVTGPCENGDSLQKSLVACQIKIQWQIRGKTVLQLYGRRDKNEPMAKDQNRVRAHVTIRGRVQGVYFRASTVYEAQNLGLTGWVRNSPDGSVEAVAEGTCEKIEELIAWCKKGPSGARVTNVEVDWAPAQNKFHVFGIVR